ncbi:polysaccharide pyruvyl transferase family protein [Enterococcus sp. AZ109]|uniref:polysaccharide pyruvyl transferase family protein n=1 Tax=Enterococcus sp. AZ109 TaxID=2774634 RepID=UPI003F1F0CDB
MKTLLVSFIDSSNIGDRLIAEMLAQQLLLDTEVIKYSYKLVEESQINVNKFLERRSIIQEFYYRYLRELPGVKNIVSKKKWSRSRKKMYDPAAILQFENALQQADLLVIGGGNAIFDLSPATLSAQRFDQVVTLACKHQVPIFVSSIGIGPFCTDKQQNAAIETLKKCDYVTFRDQRSLDYLAQVQHPAAYASVDPVFLLPAIGSFEQLKAQRSLQQRIGICLIDYRITGCSKRAYESYLQQMKCFIRQLARSQREIILYSSEVQDYETIETIYQEFLLHPQINVAVIRDKEELLELYQTLNLVVGTRMHSMIVAVSQYVPIIGLSWQQKVVEMFKNLGLEEEVLAIEALEQEMVTLVKKVEEKLVNNKQEMYKIKQCKESMQGAFAINQQIMSDLQQKLADV